MKDKINQIISTAIANKVFPGAVVLVGDDQKVDFLQAYGTTKYQDPGTVKVKTDFIFDIASVTKPFTYTAGLKLIEQGRISLGSHLAEFLPEFRGDKDRAAITIWNLFTHTSGLSFKFHSFRNYPSKHIRREILNAPIIYKTGSKVLYDNINAMLVAEIITIASGRKFVDYLQEEVLNPLRLSSTCFRPSKKLLPKIVPTESGGWRNKLVHGEVHDGSAFALGGIAGHAGLFSTVQDLWKFGAIWLNHGISRKTRLLSAKTVALATEKQIKDHYGWMGLGWKINHSTIMGHSPAGTYGHAGFTGTSLVICPSKNKIVTLLSNRIYPQRGPMEPINKIRNDLCQILLGK